MTDIALNFKEETESVERLTTALDQLKIAANNANTSNLEALRAAIKALGLGSREELQKIASDTKGTLGKLQEEAKSFQINQIFNPTAVKFNLDQVKQSTLSGLKDTTLAIQAEAVKQADALALAARAGVLAANKAEKERLAQQKAANDTALLEAKNAAAKLATAKAEEASIWSLGSNPTKHTSAAKTAIKGYYDSWGTFIAEGAEKVAATKAAKEASIWALGSGPAKHIPAAKAAITGYYDSWGVFISEGAAKAASVKAAEEASIWALGSGPAKHVPAVRTALKGYYDSWGVFITEGAAKVAAVKAAEEASIWALGSGPTKHVPAIKTAIKGYYDSWGTFIAEGTEKVAATKAAAEASIWALGSGPVKHTPAVKAAITGYYDSWGVFISESAAKAAAVAKAAEESIWSLGSGPTKHLPAAKSTITGYYDALGLFVSEGSAKLTASIKTAQAQVAAAMNSATGSYQKFNPTTGLAGAVVNPIHPQAIQSTNALNTATVSLTGSHKAMNDGLRGLVQSLGMYSSTMSAIIPMMAGMAIGSGLKHMLDQGRDLEYQMTFIAKLTDGAVISVEQFSKAMEGSQLTTKEGALGLRALAQAGLSAEDALTALPSVMNLAVVGEMQLGAAALVATGVMHAFNLQMTDMGHIIDVMTKAAAISNTSVEGMATAMKTASVVSDQFGISLEEVSSGLVVMAKRNIEGTSGGTAMKNFITNLASTTPIAAARMKQLGIEVYDTEGNLKKMSQIIPELATAFVGLNEKTKNEALKDLFNERGRRAAAALIKDVTLYGEVLGKLANESKGFAANVVRGLDQTVTGQIKATANALSISFDEAFAHTSNAWSNLIAQFTDAAKSSGLRIFVEDVAKATITLVDNLGKLTAAAAAIAVAVLAWQTYGAAVLAAEAASVAAGLTTAAVTVSLEAQAAAAAHAATATGVFSAVLSRIAWPVAIVSALWGAFEFLASNVDAATEAQKRYARQGEETLSKLDALIAKTNEESEALRLQTLEHLSLAEAVRRVRREKGLSAGGEDQGQEEVRKTAKKLAEATAAADKSFFPKDSLAFKMSDVGKAYKSALDAYMAAAAASSEMAKQAPAQALKQQAADLSLGVKAIRTATQDNAEILREKITEGKNYVDELKKKNPKDPKIGQLESVITDLEMLDKGLGLVGETVAKNVKITADGVLSPETLKTLKETNKLAKDGAKELDKFFVALDKPASGFEKGPRSPHVERVKLETTNILEEQAKRDKLILDAEKNAAANRKSVLDAELAANMITKSRYAAEVQYMEEQFAASSIAEINKQQEARAAAYIEAEGKVFAAQAEFNRRNKGNPVAISDNDRAIAKARADSANTYVTAYLTSEAQIKAIQDKANTETEVAAAKHKGELKKIDKDFADWEVSELALKEKNLRAVRNAAALRDATPMQAAVLTAESAEFERLTANAEKYDVQIRELTDSKIKYEESLKLITVRSEKDEAIAKIEEETNKKVLEQLNALLAMKAKLVGGIPVAVKIKGEAGADEFIRLEVARIGDALTDAIISSGKDGGAGLRAALEAELLTKPFKMVIEALLQPITTSIAQSVVGSAGAGAASGMVNSALGAIIGTGATMTSLGTAFGTGFASTLAGGSIANGATLGSFATDGAAGSGMAGSIGAAAPYVVAALIAAGVVERAQGSVSAAGIYAYGQNSAKGFQTGGRADFIQEGGGGTTLNSSWFDPGKETSQYMAAMGELVIKSVKEWAAAIGLSVDAVDGYTETVQAAIGNGMTKAEERQSIDKAMAGYGDAMVESVFSQIMGFAKGNEAPSATLERLGNDVTAVNNILRDNGHALYDASFESAKAVQVLINSVGGMDKFTALASNLETVNNVLTKLGQGTFDLSMEGAQAADALANSVGGAAKLSEMADELIHVNDNLEKLGKPLLDVSVAGAQLAHGMVVTTDLMVKAQEKAERLQASYANFTGNLSNADTNSVSSLQAIFDKAMSAVKVAIPSVSSLSDVTYDQYASYTDPQRAKLDTAASAFKNLQDAINSAAKTAQDAAKSAQDAADTAAQAYTDALKSIEDSTRDTKRQLSDFGKTDFQKKLSAINYAGQDKQAELDKLSAKAAELSAAATSASLTATSVTLGTVSTLSNDLISASTDLSADSATVADNIKDTLANSTAALGDALTLVPAISALFDGILAGLLKIPPALQLVSGAVTAVGGAAANAAGGLTAFSGAASAAGAAATSATGPVNSVGAAFSAITPSASAAGAALSALGTAFGAASAALTSLTATFGGASSALDGLNAAFASAAIGLGSLGSAFESAGAAGASLAGSLGAVSGAMEGIAGAAAGAAGGIAAAVSALSAASSVQAPSVAAATATAVPGFSEGGHFRGAGTPTSDSNLVWLSDDEYVIRAASVKKYGTGVLDAVNAGTLKSPIYRAGGTPPSGAVAANVDANTQLEYQRLFESLAQTFKFGVKTFAQAMQTAKDTLGATYTIPDTESGIIEAIQKLLTNSQPGADGTFSPEAMSSLGTLDKLMPSINTVLATLKDRADWQSKLDVLTGKTTERELALQKDLASTTDTATQTLIRQVYAQEDLNKAREEEAKALDSVRDALKNFQKESSSLEAELHSAFGTSGGDNAAKTIRKDLALADVRKSVEDAGLLQSSPAYAAMSAADKLKTNATIQDIRDTAALAEKQYDLNEARREEIKLLADAKSRLKSYTDAGASKEIEKMRLQGNDAGANAAQRGIDLADVFKSTADAMALLKTEGLTPLDIAALNLTISTNKATEAQYDRNIALDAEIEILGRYKSVQEDAAATEIELLKAQGETAKATAIELANATKGFNDAQIATYRQTQANKGLIASLGNLSSTADMVKNSRIGLLTAQGDKTGAAALQRELDIAPYVKSIANATAQLGLATTQTEKDALNLTIATDKQSIANYDLSKSYDAQAQAAADAQSAANALAQSYEDLKKQISQANVELLRAQGDTAAADEAAMALALRDHAGDAYYETLYRELLTIQKLTSARQQLNGMEDTAVQNQIKLIRAEGGGTLANALERSAFLKNATAPAASAQAELNRANTNWGMFAAQKGVGVSPQYEGIASYLADLASRGHSIQGYLYNTPENYGVRLPTELRDVLAEFSQTRRTDAQKSTLQSVVDTAQGIAAAYDRNKSLEAELKIIELQDEAYKANLDAQQKVTDAQKAYADVLRSTIGTMRDFLSTLDGAASPLQNLSTARANFQAVAGKAASGDTSAYKDLTPAARAFLDLSKNYSKSLVDYQRDEARVRTTLSAVINANQRELDKLPKEIAAAADPTKEAWIKLQEATKKEAETSIMLTALGVDKAASTKRLRTSEETLADRYIEAVYLLDEAKKTPLLKAFNDAIALRANSAVLPEYTAFNLGDIWGEQIAKVLPPYQMTNEEWNALIATKFPGLVPSDFVGKLTTDGLTDLIRGVMPAQLTVDSLISTTADVSDIVNTKIGEILPANFAGASFDAQQMMQDAINRAMAVTTPARPVVTDLATTAVNKVQEQGLSGGTSGTGPARPVVPDLSTNFHNTVQDQGLGGGSSGVGTSSVEWGSLTLEEKAKAAGVSSSSLYNIDYLKDIVATYQREGVTDSPAFLRLKDYLHYRQVPGFAVGTNYVPHDMIAQIHEGEAIIPEPFNPERYNKASGNDALVAEIKALRAEVESLRKSTEAGNNAIAANTNKTARLMNKFDIDGLPATRT